MFYHRILEGPTKFEHKGQTVEYFTILPANGEGLEERNAPVIMTKHDLTMGSQLQVIKMMEAIDIHYDDKTYEFRNIIVSKDDDGNIEKMVVETEIGF